MKKLITIVLLATTLASCTRKDAVDDNTAPYTESDHTPTSDGNPAFAISGVKDLDLGKSGKGFVLLPLNITQNSGRNRDTVNVSIYDLPAGVYAQVTPQDGITPFSAVIRVSTDYGGSGGDITAHVRGIGHSGTLSYPLVLHIPKYNGFEMAGTTYRRDSVYVDTSTRPGSRYIAMYSSNTDVRLILTFAKGVPLPVANASVRIAANSNSANAMQLQVYDFGHIYTATGSEERYGRFTFDSGKNFTFKCTDVEISDGVEKRRLSASFAR